MVMGGYASVFCLFGVVSMGLMGCAPRPPSAVGPSQTLRAYARALRAGQARSAYRLLSDEAKRSLSFEAFRRMVEENPNDVADIARSLTRKGSTPVVTARVAAPNGEVLELVYEDGKWTIDGTGIDRYNQDSPRRAMQAFLRAFERKRFDILMRFVPRAEIEGKGDPMWGPMRKGASSGLTEAKLRAAWTGEEKKFIQSTVEAIKSALQTAKIEQTDNRAAMPYGSGGTVLFLREDGRWKIEDLR